MRPPALLAAAAASAVAVAALVVLATPEVLAQAKPPPAGAGGGGPTPSPEKRGPSNRSSPRPGGVAGGGGGGGPTPMPGKPAPAQAGTPPGRPPPVATPPTRPPPGQQQAALPGKPPPLPRGEAEARERARREIGSGTGFVVAERRALTNHHVVRECASVRARLSGGAEIEATVRASDRERDLALLELAADGAGPPIPFRRSPEVRRGEAVVTYGFPLAGVLSSGPTLTTGDISALAGLADNAAQFQISAPVQPGNSGGPLLDGSGNVVGVIVSKLNAQRIAQRTGDIPQNVNFAVKGTEALEFLRRNRVEPTMADSTTTRTPAEVGETVHPSVLFLRCYR